MYFSADSLPKRVVEGYQFESVEESLTRLIG